MIYWIIQKLPSTTNGKPNQIGYGKVEGYYSTSRLEILIPTSCKVNQGNWRDEMNKISLSHIGWYPTIGEARLEAKEMKQNGIKYRIKRMDVGCILYQLIPNKQEKGENDNG